MTDNDGNPEMGSLRDLGVGDHVAAREHFGGIVCPTTRRGTAGIVVVRKSDGLLKVAFANGRTLMLDPGDVTVLNQADPL